VIFFEELSKELTSSGIDLFAPIPLKSCKLTKKYLLERAGIEDGTVIICAVPYLSTQTAGEHNISAYCAVRDYHSFFSELWKNVCAKLSLLFPESKFAGFADHSPIDERDAALRAGIGIMGENGMIITEKYSSYIFLGELITDIEVNCVPKEPQYCIGCKKCKKACPMTELGNCLSAITQKKGELTDNERTLIKENKTAWGCDICQAVCPVTKKAIKNGTAFTNIDYFKTGRIERLTEELVENMSNEEFKSRAFSWRGKAPLLRNLKILSED